MRTYSLCFPDNLSRNSCIIRKSRQALPVINSHQIAVNSLFYIKLIKSSLLILHIHVTFNVGYNHFCIHLQKKKNK